jgi:hypothetical protein
VSGEVPPDVTNELEMSYAGAMSVAAEYRQYATQITAAAQGSFLEGDQYAYLAGIIAVVIGASLVFFVFPKRDEERTLLAGYHAEDLAVGAEPGAPGAAVPEPVGTRA